MATTTAPAELLRLPVARPSRRRAPSFRDGFVPRPRLVRALQDATGGPLAVIVAPAGYGKTTLLAEWAAHESRPVAWVTADEAWSDPDVLVAALEEALDAADPVGGGGLSHLESRRPFVLVIDDAHLLRGTASAEMLEGVTQRIPPGSRLAVSGRTEPPLPIGRLRAHRAVTEIRMRELTMTGSEAHGLLALAGLDVSQAELEMLLARTEGWPVGLYLGALSVLDQLRSSRAVTRFGGDDTVVSEYFRDECFSQLSPAQLGFLRRSSVLDRLSGPACDSIMNRRGSIRQLRDLACRGVMLVPLDRSGETFRLHALFREALRGELHRLAPDEEMELHRRAGAWHEARGEVDEAIEHSIAAGDTQHAGDLMWANLAAYVGRGRNAVLRRWLSSFTDEQVDAHPRMALAAAHSHLAAGELDLARRAESASRQIVSEGAPPDLEAAAALLSAATCEGDLVRVAASVKRAYELAPDAGPWRAECRFLNGVALHLTGDRAGATGLLEEAVRRGAVVAPDVQTRALAQLALLRTESDDWEGAASYVKRACAQMDAYGLGDYPTSALVHATSAFVHSRRGQIEEAKAHLTHGRRLLEQLGDYVPWYEVETRIALARAALRLNDITVARGLLSSASRRAERAPDALVLIEWLQQVAAAIASASGLSGADSLTTAELRVLALLPTHLSFREIAGRLYVTANTVKTQAHSVYRKFDASSRSEAVARAIELGLLE